jgi:pimeloyl-ACP methyl ester carboxylesterase
MNPSFGRSVGGALLAALMVAGPAEAQSPSRRLEEASYQTVGGIAQWVTIRADDGRHPVLLLLHGGPGDVQSPFVSTYAPYEKDFVLVQWDQRGAGRTFARNGAAGVSLERLVADGADLAGQLRARFPNQKLIVFGHSWGSVIATALVQARPDLFDAYVGTGQVASWAGMVQFQFDFLERRYRESGDAAALAALEAIGTPDPKNVGQYFTFSRPIRQYLNPSDTAWLKNMRALALANGETEATLEMTGAGATASGAALIGSSVSENLSSTALRFDLPYYVIQGRHDLFTPTPLAEAYFNAVVAPRKRLVVIEDAGHFALATHQDEVLAALKTMVP